MSEVRAGRIPYTGAPDIEPRAPQVGAEYQRIETNPRQFGAQIGQALESVGAEMRQASDLYSEVAAQQAMNGWQQQIGKILTGDPAVPGDTGLYGKRGQAFMEAMPAAQQQIEALTNSTLGGLGTVRSQIAFSNEARRYQTWYRDEIGRKYDQENNQWMIDTNNAQYENNRNLAAMRPDDERFGDAALGNMNAARIQLRQLKGELRLNIGDPSKLTPREREIYDQELHASLVDLKTAQIHSLIGQNNAPAAQRIFDQYRDVLSTSPHFDALAATLEHHTKIAQATALAFGGGAVTTPTGGANNPGNIRPVGAASGFNSYRDVDEGLKAISGNLLAYQDIHGINTIAGVISRWAPPSENDTGRLILNASARTGYAPDQTINLHDSATLANVTHAIVMQEQGHLPSGVTLDGIRGIADGATGAAASTTASDHSIPGLAPQIDSIISRGTAAGVDPEVISAAISLARERYNAQYTDEERSRTLARQAQQDASDKAENAIVADAFGGQPQITARQISQMPDLKPEARLRMLEFLRRTISPGDPVVSRQTTIALLGDMRRPAGDQERISDMGPIYDAYNQGKLTREDFTFLQKQFTDFRGDDGQKLLTTENEFIKGMQSSITKANVLLGKLDPEGDQKFYRFHWDVDHAIEEHRKAGKNPFDLFDPSKPDYLGKAKALQPYMTSLQESSEAVARSFGGGAQPPAAAAVPTVAPRKPGESMGDWVARTHQGLPGVPAAPSTTSPTPTEWGPRDKDVPSRQDAEGYMEERDTQGRWHRIEGEAPIEGAEGTPPEAR